MHSDVSLCSFSDLLLKYSIAAAILAGAALLYFLTKIFQTTCGLLFSSLGQYSSGAFGSLSSLHSFVSYLDLKITFSVSPWPGETEIGSTDFGTGRNCPLQLRSEISVSSSS